MNEARLRVFQIRVGFFDFLNLLFELHLRLIDAPTHVVERIREDSKFSVGRDRNFDGPVFDFHHLNGVDELVNRSYNNTRGENRDDDKENADCADHAFRFCYHQ